MKKEIHRQRTKAILKDLEKKMVFVVGPRQAGKTYLSKQIAKKFQSPVFLNYDFIEDRNIIHNLAWDTDADLIVFDELHKMRGWKNFLKGVYDKKPEKMKILVTGSARLDVYRKTGDSMAGRFFVHHLMPFCPSELADQYNKRIGFFMERGGFPEPFLADSEIEAQKWRNGYIDSLLRDDVFSLKKIVNIKLLENIFAVLRRKIGSPISYSSIASDVQSSHSVVKNYIDLLESLYIIFRVPTFSKKISRSILKEQKIYFFDTGMVVGDRGVKFENFAAVCLLKECLRKNDLYGKKYGLKYLRDKEGREVDFVVAENDDIVKKIIEVKLSKSEISKHLRYFSKKYDFPALQVVKNLHTEKEINGIKIVKAENFFQKINNVG